MEKIALDRGYDTGTVHRGLELLGIQSYIPAIQFPNTPAKFGFHYLAHEDAFLCPMGQLLTYHRLNCNKSTGKYLRCYQVQGNACQNCCRKEDRGWAGILHSDPAESEDCSGHKWQHPAFRTIR